MFTFLKIRTSAEKDCWMLKISNHEELLDYMRFFSGRAWQGAKVCVNRIKSLGEISHLGEDPEAIMIKYLAEKDAKEDGSFELKPLKHTTDLISLKWKGMASVLETETIAVGSAGGYCQLSAFLDAHGASIIDEIRSEELVFPSTFDPGEARKYKTIILENDNELDYNHRKITGRSDFNHYILDKLKLRSKDEVMFYLTHCKEIIAKTTFLDENQIIKFLKIFSTLSEKTIMIISDSIDENIQKLRENESVKPILEKVFANNRVVFYNTSLEITKTSWV